MPLGVHQPLTDGDGLGERPGGVFQRGEQEVPQRVVAGHGEAVFERPHERVGGVLREDDEALADIAGGGVASASSRSTPLLPPSSAVATTALVCTPSDSRVQMETGGPVPPPMTTARRVRSWASRPPRCGRALFRAEKAAVAAGSTRKASVRLPALLACGLRASSPFRRACHAK